MHLYYTQQFHPTKIDYTCPRCIYSYILCRHGSRTYNTCVLCSLHVYRVIEQERLLEVQALRVEELMTQISQLEGKEHEVRSRETTLNWNLYTCTYNVHVYVGLLYNISPSTVRLGWLAHTYTNNTTVEPLYS